MNILCEYQKKIKMYFLFIFLFRKYMFCVQLYGEWDCWGRYNLYFEALKGLLLKNTPWFLSDFCRKCQATIPEHNSVGPQPQSIKSLPSPCDYTRVVCLYLCESIFHAKSKHSNDNIKLLTKWKRLTILSCHLLFLHEIHTLCVHYAHAAANLNSGYSK